MEWDDLIWVWFQPPLLVGYVGCLLLGLSSGMTDMSPGGEKWPLYIFAPLGFLAFGVAFLLLHLQVFWPGYPA